MGFANGEFPSRNFPVQQHEPNIDLKATDKFPASAAFDVINSSLTASEADRKDAIKKGSGVYAFTLKNKAGETESWHIDLKEKGAVGTGLGNKPSGEMLFRCAEDTISSKLT